MSERQPHRLHGGGKQAGANTLHPRPLPEQQTAPDSAFALGRPKRDHPVGIRVAGGLAKAGQRNL